MCAVCDIESFNGSLTTSTTSFNPHNISEIDLKVDSKSVSNYPIKRNLDKYNEFYLKFLKNCNFFDNPNISDVLTYSDFVEHNFLLVENLKRKKILNGNLTLHLKFGSLLTEKLYVLILPLVPKKLKFDESATPFVVDFSGKKDNEIY